MYKNSSKFLSHLTHGDFSSKVMNRCDSTKKVPKGITAAAENGKHVCGSIVEAVKGGIKVRLNGAEGFCPYSEFSKRISDSELERLITKKTQLKFKVLKATDQKSIVVSLKRAMYEVGMETARSSLSSCIPIEGTVREIMPYGAFVDVGGVDGLIHVSKCPIATPLAKGDKVIVKILSIDDDSKRISLALARDTAIIIR